MAYKRKTEDVWGLFWDYGFGIGAEEICSAESMKEARRLRKEYLENEGICPVIRRYRVKKSTV